VLNFTSVEKWHSNFARQRGATGRERSAPKIEDWKMEKPGTNLTDQAIAADIQIFRGTNLTSRRGLAQL
jgi:hypothetical protein